MRTEIGARIAPLNALQVKRMLAGRSRAGRKGNTLIAIALRNLVLKLAGSIYY
jgi:hypothetical protein